MNDRLYAIDTPKIFGGAAADRITSLSCYKATHIELPGNILVLGFKFDEPVFMHAITHVQNMYSGNSW